MSKTVPMRSVRPPRTSRRSSPGAALAPGRASGSYNIFLKATWTPDGRRRSSGGRAPQGLAAGTRGARRPAALAGVSRATSSSPSTAMRCWRREQVRGRLSQRSPGAASAYSCCAPTSAAPLRGRGGSRSPRATSRLFYYLSLVGFFSLVVGTIVMLRRPPDRAALHFYAICLLFFLMYSTSYTGKLNLGGLDAALDGPPRDPVPARGVPALLPRRSRSGGCATRAAWLIPPAYMPALALAGAAVASQVLFVTTPRQRGAVADHAPPSTAGSRSTSRALFARLLRDPARLLPPDPQPRPRASR